jgi:lipopolysaccharide transport system ATP-binding protein
MPSIEAFADIGDFVAQPVKFYSSGMYVRLAFAIIAHVKADILVIDEALAVGDAIFTQKCMDFIRTFKKTGTLLFVSHDNNAVLALCDQALWLNQGHIEKIGPAKDVTEAYLRFTLQQNYGDQAELKPVAIAKTHETTAHAQASGWQTGSGEITAITLTDADGSRPVSFEGGEHITLIVKARATATMTSPIIGFMVRDRLGQDLFGENTLVRNSEEPLILQPGEIVEARFTFTLPLLPNGDYGVLVAFAEGTQEDHIQHHWLSNAVVITVSSPKVRWGLVGLACDQVTLKRSD